MKRANSFDEPPTDLLIRLGKNALFALNSIPAYSKYWIPMLNLLTIDITFSELSRFIDHGSPDTVSKAMKKASELTHNLLIERIPKEKSIIKEKEKKVAEEFLVSHTKESSSQRLITKESISSLYTEYLGCVQDPLHKDTFTHVYRNLRVLKDKHCNYSIYTCPKCEDDLPAVEALVKKLSPQKENCKEDYEKALSIYEHLQEHKAKAKIQMNYFESLWDNPPESTLIAVEDAGKRFVLDGKGCAHIVMTRQLKDQGISLF